MKKIFYFSLLTFFFSCVQTKDSVGGVESIKQDSIIVESKIDLVTDSTDSFKKEKNEDTIFVKDSTIIEQEVGWYNESDFVTLNLGMTEITKEQFETYKANCSEECSFTDFGISDSSRCNEICESFLIEKSTGNIMNIPSSYDAGLLGVFFSPSCTQLIAYSSYDGPEYEQFYNHRSEFFIFTTAEKQGLKGFKPSHKYFNQEWSIYYLNWINEEEIFFKTYDEWADFKYFTVKLQR